MKEILFKISKDKNEKNKDKIKENDEKIRSKIKELQQLDPRIGQVIISNDNGDFYGYASADDNTNYAKDVKDISVIKSDIKKDKVGD